MSCVMATAKVTLTLKSFFLLLFEVYKIFVSLKNAVEREVIQVNNAEYLKS